MTSFHRLFRIAILPLATALLAIALPAAAQSPTRVVGTVRDNQGGVLPGVTVTATSPSLIGAQSVVSEGNGTYQFPTLPPGAYTLLFELPGFQQVSRDKIVLALGQTLTVFTEVTLKSHRQIDFARFQQATQKIDEIIECHLVSGGYDYLLKFVTPGLAHYQSVIESMLEGNLGIEKYFSYIVIKSPFIKTHCPIERLFPHPR